jgi:predicted Na+-dependent transporter
MAINSQSKKVVREAAIWGAVATASIFAHTYVLPFDTTHRLLVPIFLGISILTKRDVPFIEKMKSHALWAAALSLILFIFLAVSWRAPVVRSLILSITMVGFFAPATYVLSLIVGRIAKHDERLKK